MAASVYPMIIVDRRQPEDTAQFLLGLDIPAKVDDLITGDEVWDSPFGPVGVEEKTWDELLTLGDRIDDQLMRCINEFAVPILMVKGEVRELWGKALPYAHGNPVKIDFDRLDNNLFEWQMRGLFIKHCPQPEMRVYRLAGLWRWTTKPTHRTSFARQRKMPNLKRLSARAEVLASLPSVGIKRASKLAAAAVPLRAMFGWDEKAWASYLGSKKAAAKIVALLAEKP